MMKVKYLFSIALLTMGMSGDFHLESKEFTHNSKIPEKFTCDGKNISPELQWSNSPVETKSLVLMMDDIDAIDVAFGNRDHWIVYNIPNDIKKLEENIQVLPGSAEFGYNTENIKEYYGPCPPKGEHRYFFKLYALDKMLNSQQKISIENINQLIQGHILAESILIGLYRRK